MKRFFAAFLLLQQAEVKERFAALGAESMPMDTDQFALHLRAETAKFARAIRDSGATAELDAPLLE